MKKNTTISFWNPVSMVLLFAIIFGTPIGVSGQTFVGTIFLRTQEELNDFGANYTDVMGNLLVIENTEGAIVDLSGLSNLNSVSNNFGIQGNTALLNTDGLDNLSSVGGVLSIFDNDGLTNLTGFPNLTSVGTLEIAFNSSLVVIDDLPNLNTVEDLSIFNNEILPHLPGFTGLSTLTGNLLISQNFALMDILGFINLTEIEGTLTIGTNHVLTNINGFSNLSTIGTNLRITNNDLLTNIDGLAGLLSISQNLIIAENYAINNIDGLANLNVVEKHLSIRDNFTLSNCCGIAHLVDDNPDNGVVIGNITINDNPNFCANQTQIIDACSSLPPGWEASPDGIGCTNGNEASFDDDTQTFTIESVGCYDPNYYSNADAHGFVYTELCGDGEIIAEIQSVDGDGWAGISMRESTDPGAKMLQLLIDGVFLTQRQMRTSTGGLAYKHQFQTQGKNWLRLTRSGSYFSAFHSSDAVNWSVVIATNISMPNCIPVGLVTMNSTPNGSLTATFGNVQIKTNSTLYTPQTIDISETSQQLSIYPNPANDRLWISLPPAIDQEVQVKVYDQLGQPVTQQVFDAPKINAASMDVSTLPSGAYVVEVLFGEQREVQKILVE